MFINTSTSGSFNVITPSNLRGHTTISFNGAGETVTCIFKNWFLEYNWWYTEQLHNIIGVNNGL